MTLATLPLVMHAMDTRAIYAGKKYLLLSMAGAAMVFVSIISLHEYGTTLTYLGRRDRPGAVPRGTASSVRRIHSGLLWFWGKGGSGSVSQLASRRIGSPHSGICPSARGGGGEGRRVCLMRVVYWCFGAEFLIGTKVQAAVLCVCCAAILYGSLRALCTQHLKRRLAYSTVSQLSYILMGVMLMTPAGLAAGLTHMVCHALMKITLFFCAGAILYKGGREYVYELRGVGRAMPVTMTCFTWPDWGWWGFRSLRVL